MLCSLMVRFDCIQRLSVVSVCVDVCVNVFVMKRRSVVVTLFVCRAVAMCCAP